MGKKYRSEAMAAVHETMEALHDVGTIDKRTMRRFDDACLTAIRPLTWAYSAESGPNTSFVLPLAERPRYRSHDQIFYA